MSQIAFIDGATGKMKLEKVYGEAWVKWLYQSPSGKLVKDLFSRPFLSKLYGWYQNHSLSKRKITPFINQFSISMDEFLPAEGKTHRDPYGSFNEFFIRRFRPDARPFCQEEQFPAPCEGRYLGHEEISSALTFPVKGHYLNYKKLLAHNKWAEAFAGGPLFIARLCPVDYHRFHFPDDGYYLDSYRIQGRLHSVNPMALQSKEDIFITNERHISILELKHFGKMAFIEVGATCVGKIKQLHPPDQKFKRGEEKGMFLFGGSTVIGIGQRGKWALDKNLLRHTGNHLETYLQLGRPLGHTKMD